MIGGEESVADIGSVKWREAPYIRISLI